MKIAVCISNVPDTTTKIKFVDNNTQLDVAGIQWIINPWDELALTRAIELKEQSAGKIESVTVITVGKPETEPTIRKALAIGADKGIRVNSQPTDAYFVASQIAEVVKKENFDLIFCGIESSDYNGSLVGGMLAELIDVASISSVSNVTLDGDDLTVKREMDGGYETISAKTPVVLVVQKGIAIEPRIPAMRGIMAARTKPLSVVEPANIDVFTNLVSFELPKPKAACKKIDAENLKELVDLLHNEAKVI